MKCVLCGATDRLNKITGLSFQLNGVERQASVSVTGIHCGRCGFLGLEMNGAAAPVEVTNPIRNNPGILPFEFPIR
jgi:hypothetical protein